MKTNIRIPGELYTTLYKEIISIEFKPESDYDDTLSGLEIEIGDFMVYLDAIFEVERDFDGDPYSKELEDIVVHEVVHFDKDNNETDVTSLFDVEKFWNQFKKYVIKKNDIYIHHGDEAVVTSQNTRYRFWVKATFLYYDTRLRLAICTPNIHAKSVIKRAYPYVFPATTQNLRLVK